jgi:plasmid stabilization system protein ParE
VFLTDRALEQIRGIEQYSVDRWGRRVADKYLDEIQCALDHLKDQPDHVKSDLTFGSSLGFYRVRKHILACTTIGQAIYVLAVFHTSMDLPSRLAELEPTLLAEAQFLHQKLREPH